MNPLSNAYLHRQIATCSVATCSVLSPYGKQRIPHSQKILKDLIFEVFCLTLNFYPFNFFQLRTDIAS